MFLSRVLCSDRDLNFGECNASKFGIQVSDIEDISGMKIQVYETVSGYESEILLFEGIVDSAKIQPDHTSRAITAYDVIYFHSDDDISEWYDNLFTSAEKPEYKGVWSSVESYVSGNVVQYGGKYYQYLCGTADKFSITEADDEGNETTVFYSAVEYCTGKNPEDILEDEYASQYVQELEVYNPYDYGSVTVKQFRDSLMEYVGITQEETDLLNDSVLITKTIDSSELKFIDCIKAVCQMNACFGHVSETGIFQYIRLGGDAVDYSGNYKASGSSYEEFYTKPIDSVRIYDNAGVASAIYGSGSNPWNLVNNFLLYGLDADALNEIAETLFDYVSAFTYVPASIQALISLPVGMGDKISVTTHEGETFETYVLKDTLSGAQLTSQTVEADGSEMRNNTTSLSDALSLLESKTTAIVEEIYDKLTVEYAEIKTIQGNLANYKVVVAEEIQVTVGNITTLLAGSAGVGELEAIHLTSGNVVIDNAVITDAMIASVSAGKLTAGNIYTSQVRIYGDEDKCLSIVDNTIQISDTNAVVRVQIGEDASGDYNMYLWDADGNLMWNATGATAAGLNDGIIRDIAVADDAAISGYKLDIDSVTEYLNKTGGLTVDASRVKIDDTTLDAAYTSIKKTSSALEGALETLEDTNSVVGITPYYSLTSRGSALLDAYGEELLDAQGEDLFDYSYTSGDAYDDFNAVLDWTPDCPEDTDGLVLWVRYLVSYEDGTEEYTDAVCLTDRALWERSEILTSDFTVVQGQITAKVWMSDIETAADALGNEITTLYDQYAELEVTLQGVTATVGLVSTDGTHITNISGMWSLTADGDGSYLTAQADYVAFTANHYITIKSENFTLSETGVITASSGTIGGWTFTSGKIYGGDADTGTAVVQRPQSSTTWVFAAGGSSHSSYTDCPFRVSKAGKLYSTSAEIGGWQVGEYGIYNDTYKTGFINIGAFRIYAGTYTYSQMVAKASSGDDDYPAFGVTEEGQVYCQKIYVSSQANFSGGAYHFANIYLNNSKYLMGYDTSYSSYYLIGISSSDNVAINSAGCGSTQLYSGTSGVVRVLRYSRTSNAILDLGSSWSSSYAVELRCYWADSALHDLVVRASDGLTASFGYAGTSSCATVAVLRGRTVKYTNSSGTTTLSDANLKTDVLEFDERYNVFFDSLIPRTYKYILGSAGRPHAGFVTQEVESALETAGLTTADFAGVNIMPIHGREQEEDENGNMADIEGSSANYLLDKGITEEHDLLYHEFIALNTWQIQQAKAQLAVCMELIEKQAEEISMLKQQIYA